MKFFIKILLFTIIIIVSACTSANDGCHETIETQLLAKFYEVVETKEGGYEIKTLTVDSINVKGQGVDSILYKNQKKAGSIKLPLKKFYTQCAFEIMFNNVTDIITITYTNSEPYFISLECGCEILPTIENVTFTHNYIDSVEIVNKTISIANPQNVENIKIYHFN
ncbi:MAG: hypothetical protein LBN23_06385 [Paludibacter sp.]|jgi:hypothetical protein|nr:hypothetical protein [Paludibacter sp.]